MLICNDQVFVLVYLAENYRKRGQLHKAYSLYQQALECATQEKGKKLPIAGRVLLGMGEILREWNDPRAEEYLLEGIDLSGQWGTVTAISGYFSLSHIFMAKNDWVKANDMLQKARQLAYYSDITEIDDLMVDIFQVRFWIEQGNLSAAREWCKKEGLYQNIDIAEMEKKDDFIAFHMRKYEYPIVMRLWMMEGRFAEAQAFLEDLLIKLENWERPILVIETHILLALALFGQHKTEPAINQLEIALSLAEPEGFMRTFLNEGESLHALLKLTVANLKAESLRAYGQRLLQAFSSGGYQSKKGEISEKSGVFLEPLSERELDVLRLLASSLSVPEMAAELVVSVHTVRSHIKNIYSKLDVHNRYVAVERGKELGII
jgi:LuxR family maltose regulon positive regulatory protein